MLSVNYVRRGLAGLEADSDAMARDLDGAWAVLGEPIQSAMRALAAQGVPGMDAPYERLRELTRGRHVDASAMQEFIAGLGLPPEVEKRLVALTPASYTGLAAQLVQQLDPPD